jgi:3-methyladenine DNA glycosylase AlkD
LTEQRHARERSVPGVCLQDLGHYPEGIRPGMRNVMHPADVMRAIDALASGDVRAGMARFGIPTDNARGVSTPQLKALARKIGRDHTLAARLWASGVFEARIIAAFIDEPSKVTRAQMDRWARDLNSWAVCDACCCYLFRRTAFAWDKALEWAGRDREFVKRAGFALMAYLAVHDKAAEAADFAELLPVIERESDDDRPFVRKAVNWALRQIGKRNLHLNSLAIEAGERIRARGTRAARGIAADALRELRGAAVQARLKRKG